MLGMRQTATDRAFRLTAPERSAWTDRVSTRTIELALNNVPSTPVTLIDPSTHATASAVSFPIRTLFHHYFIAKYGDHAEPPSAYEYESLITSGPDWRFRGSGIGADKEAKRNVSNELGKAFGRWLLHDHLA